MKKFSLAKVNRIDMVYTLDNGDEYALNIHRPNLSINERFCNKRHKSCLLLTIHGSVQTGLRKFVRRRTNTETVYFED